MNLQEKLPLCTEMYLQMKQGDEFEASFDDSTKQLFDNYLLISYDYNMQCWNFFFFKRVFKLLISYEKYDSVTGQ